MTFLGRESRGSQTMDVRCFDQISDFGQKPWTSLVVSMVWIKLLATTSSVCTSRQSYALLVKRY